MLLDLHRKGTVTPGRELRVERRHQGIGDDSHGGGGRVEQAVVHGMGRVDLVATKAIHHEIESFEGGHRSREVDRSKRGTDP